MAENIQVKREIEQCYVLQSILNPKVSKGRKMIFTQAPPNPESKKD